MDIEVILPAQADERDPLEHGLITLTQAIDMIDGDAVVHGILGGDYGYGARFDTPAFAMRPFYWGDCDCGYIEAEAAWSAVNDHQPDCYSVERSTRIDATGIRALIDEAIARRSRHPWGSKRADSAQEEVNRLVARERQVEDSISRTLCAEHGIPWNQGRGSAVHCTCDFNKRWATFCADVPGHKADCSVVLPNFRHKATGLEVRWYKWIGRDMEVRNAEGVDIQAMFSECLASLPTPSTEPSS